VQGLGTTAHFPQLACLVQEADVSPDCRLRSFQQFHQVADSCYRFLRHLSQDDPMSLTFMHNQSLLVNMSHTNADCKHNMIFNDWL
jgi:hypothetical protein